MKAKLLICCLALLLNTAPAPSQVRTLPPGSMVAGLTLEEWSAEWWKWLASIPCSIHPNLDTNGTFAHVGQFGPVFYLAGSYGYAPPGETLYVTRTVTVTSDKYLFFPMVNWASDNVGRAVPLSPQELRDEVVVFAASVLEARASIDGIELAPLRLLSPIFSYTLPDGDNVFQCFGFDVPGGIYEPAASDGYWIMLAPLPPGPYVLHFRGVVGAPFNGATDLTYHLTVTRPTLSGRVAELIGSLQAADLPPSQERPLLAFLKASQASFSRDHLGAGMIQLLAFQRKVRAELSRSYPHIVQALLSHAQQIIDQAKRNLRTRRGR